MDHKVWIENELETLSQSLGFVYTPGEEIEARLERLKRGMIGQGMEAVLVVQKMDYYYLSGTAQDSLLLVPCEGPPPFSWSGGNWIVHGWSPPLSRS